MLGEYFHAMGHRLRTIVNQKHLMPFLIYFVFQFFFYFLHDYVLRVMNMITFDLFYYLKSVVVLLRLLLIMRRRLFKLYINLIMVTLLSL